MLYLWIFGDNVEEVLGTLRYVLAYSARPDGQPGADRGARLVIPTLGASGAIAGIMGMYVVWFPYNRVRVLVFRYVIEVPAIVVIGRWIAVQVWQGAGSISHLGRVGGVAYLAHVGGAATGIFVAFLFRDRARRLEALNDYRDGWFVGP